MTDRMDGDGLRLVPIEPTPDMRIAGGTAWSEALKDAGTYVDCADACYKAMIRTAPQAPDTGEGAEPLAWRWKPKHSVTWIYNPEASWLAEHKNDQIDIEPLYAVPPKPAPDHADDFGDMPSAYLAARSSLAKPAPDALQRVLCGIVGTPDANGMVTFKVHESVVRQMQAAGEPAPDALREAVTELLDVAKLMPRATPAPGSSCTEHNFKIEAGVVWANDRAIKNLEKFLSAPVQSGGGTGPDFETAARALGFCQIPSGAWYHPNQDICFTDRFKTAEEIFDHYFGGQRSYVEKASHPVRGDREAIARIIEPDAFLPQTSHHNCIYRMMTLPQAQEFALSKADAILSLRSTVDQPQAKPDRETLIHTICPHIRQYSDSHWQGNHACLQCPATVKISQGDAVQRCRRDAEAAADDVIRCWQSTGDQPTPQVSGASTPAVASHDGDTR